MDCVNEPNRGRDWRDEISKHLWDLECGVFNPCCKPCIQGEEDDETFAELNSLKEKGDFDEVSRIMSPISRIDLHGVDISNALILKVNKDTHMCGSYSEQTYASLEKKPVIVFCEQKKENIPLWLFGVGMRHEMFFDSLEQVKTYLSHIAFAKKVDTLGRWRFLDYKKIYNK
jgi:hypothetical protein